MAAPFAPARTLRAGAAFGRLRLERLLGEETDAKVPEPPVEADDGLERLPRAQSQTEPPSRAVHDLTGLERLSFEGEPATRPGARSVVFDPDAAERRGVTGDSRFGRDMDG